MSAASAAPAAASAEPAMPGVPGLWRRMACFVYEGGLLFGVSLVCGALGAAVVAAVGEQTMMHHQALLGVIGFVVYGLYFCGFWCWRGQTLAMQTWGIRLVGPDGALPTPARALARYLAAYAWLLPAVVVARLNGWTGWSMLLAIAIGIVAWALLARLHPQRQFWHDALCGTRLVTWRPPSPRQNPRP
jgi:uncharacterized RDD family membrane protein YckC